MKVKRIAFWGLVALIVCGIFAAFTFVSAPVQAASPAGQTQLTKIAPPAQATAAVPNTGGNNTTVVNNSGSAFVGSTLFWVIVLTAVIAIIAMLAAVFRGGSASYRE